MSSKRLSDLDNFSGNSSFKLSMTSSALKKGRSMTESISLQPGLSSLTCTRTKYWVTERANFKSLSNYTETWQAIGWLYMWLSLALICWGGQNFHWTLQVQLLQCWANVLNSFFQFTNLFPLCRSCLLQIMHAAALLWFWKESELHSNCKCFSRGEWTWNHWNLNTYL